jgi:hypothetical protein
MKIIKQPPEFMPFHIDCVLCKATLEIDKVTDIRLESHENGDARGETWTETTPVVKCPCCQTTLQIKKELIPNHLYQKLEPLR